MRKKDALKATNSQRERVILIRRRRCTYIGHMIRRGKLEYDVFSS